MTTLSSIAVRLLVHLRAVAAHTPQTAKTDAALAEETGIAHRHLIDAAAELLDAGYLVLAGATGRYLLLPDGPLDLAYDYALSLRSRAVDVLRRRKSVIRAIGFYRLAADGGRPRQLDLLFHDGPQPPPAALEAAPCA